MIAVLAAALVSGAAGGARAEAPGDGAGPGWTEAIERAEHLARRGDLQEAREAVAPLLERREVGPWRRLELAAVLRAAGDSETSRALAAEALGTEADLLAKAALGTLPTDGEMIEAARSPCDLLLLQRYLARLGETARSAALGREIHRREPTCPGVVATLAETLLLLGQKREVLRLLGSPELDRRPEVDLQLLRAHVLRSDGRFEEAIPILERVVRSGPEHRHQLGPLLSLYLWAGASGQPVDLWRENAERDPADAVSRFLLGAVLHYRDEFEESRRWLEEARRGLGDHPRLLIYLAMDAYNLGDPETARRLLDVAAASPTVDPDVYYCQGEILRDLDRPEAIRSLRRYLTLADRDPYGHGYKRLRVSEMIASLERCEREGATTCEGPFEHPRAEPRERHFRRLGAALGAGLLASFLVLLLRRRRVRP